MNGRLDKNVFGIPKEGYGASNNPKKSMGPPKFADAKFQLDRPENVLEIKLPSRGNSGYIMHPESNAENSIHA
jgi:uncharacterized protein (DUF2141 family)